MKIKHYVRFACQFCNKEFDNEEDCRVHEAYEMGLTTEEYKTLVQLEHDEKRAYRTLAITNNDDNRAKANFATQAVINFRREHNLEESDNIITY